MIILIDGEKGLELLCVSHEFQKNVNKEARRENLNVNLYAKRYTCEKLRNAGFSDNEIAEILGISIAMVDKLMKNTDVFLQHGNVEVIISLYYTAYNKAEVTKSALLFVYFYKEAEMRRRVYSS